MAKPFKIGDRIAYSVKFLRNTGQTGRAIGQKRMTVTAVLGEIIEWEDDAGNESGGLAVNFIHADPNTICIDATTNDVAGFTRRL